MPPSDFFAEIDAGAAAAPQKDDLRFRFTQFRDIKLDTAPPYLVHEMLPRIGVVFVWGKPKSGKTFWVYDLEMHVALGWPYRGRHVEQGEVLHIACEGVRGLGARKEAWRLHHIEDKSPAEIAEIDDTPFHLCKDTALDLIADADKVIADIVTQFGGRPIAVITIDTLNRSLNGSESKDEDMGRYVGAAITLADKFQCCVIVIHHCGHDQDRPRGHSSLLGSADALIEIKKDEHEHVCSEVEEMRDGPNGATTYSRLKTLTVGYDDNDDPITSCVIIHDEHGAAARAGKADGAKSPSPMGRCYHEALCEALHSPAAKARSESHNRISVPQPAWVAELDRRGLLDKDATSHQRSAKISKYRSELIAAKWAACNGEFIWSTREG